MRLARFSVYAISFEIGEHWHLALRAPVTSLARKMRLSIKPRTKLRCVVCGPRFVENCPPQFGVFICLRLYKFAQLAVGQTPAMHVCVETKRRRDRRRPNRKIAEAGSCPYPRGFLGRELGPNSPRSNEYLSPLTYGTSTAAQEHIDV